MRSATFSHSFIFIPVYSIGLVHKIRTHTHMYTTYHILHTYTNSTPLRFDLFSRVDISRVKQHWPRTRWIKGKNTVYHSIFGFYSNVGEQRLLLMSCCFILLFKTIRLLCEGESKEVQRAFINGLGIHLFSS